MKQFLLMTLLLAVLTGCTMPSTTVSTVESRPSISIVGAPADAVLVVDGLQIGVASQYRGDPNVLVVEPGTHRIEVRQGGATLYDQRVFVDSEHKRIVVR